MTSERILSHGLDGKVRDVMELAFLNAVLGGGSLDGKQFAYANKLATWNDEVATRKDWFTGQSLGFVSRLARRRVDDKLTAAPVCCCPPNLSRTLGILGGYTWNSKVESASKVIKLDIYLFVSATRTIALPDGTSAKVSMVTEMPWVGKANVETDAPEGWSWEIHVPTPAYAENITVSGWYCVERASVEK
jgi:DUF1680 family protein